MKRIYRTNMKTKEKSYKLYTSNSLLKKRKE